MVGQNEWHLMNVPGEVIKVIRPVSVTPPADIEKKMFTISRFRRGNDCQGVSESAR